MMMLKTRLGLSDEEIDGIIEKPEMFMVDETQMINLRAFKKDVIIDFSRFKLALNRIAYK